LDLALEQHLITQGTFIPSLVTLCHIVSEEKIFENNLIKIGKKTSKKAITPTWVNGFSRKFGH